MITLTIQASDGKGIQVGIEAKYKTEEDLRHVLESIVPLAATKGITTIFLNTFNWRCGIAHVEQNASIERSEYYVKTGN